MNVVYNFGHIFDGIRDTYLFFVEDPRGNDKAVYQAGFNLGQAIYYLITPDIADYYSDAKDYKVKSFDYDAIYDIKIDKDPKDMTPDERDAAAARAAILEKRRKEEEAAEKAKKAAAATPTNPTNPTTKPTNPTTPTSVIS